MSSVSDQFQPESEHFVFTENQILRDFQINGMIDYLLARDRESRVELFGVGIGYGLSLNRAEGGGLEISNGFGVTSTGHLVRLTETKQFKGKLKSTAGEEQVASLDSTTELFRLIDGDDGDEELKEGDLDGSTILLVVWKRQREVDVGVGEAFGTARGYEIRTILISNKQAEKIVKEKFGEDVKKEFDAKFSPLPAFVERFGCNLSGIENYDQFTGRYKDTYMEDAKRIKEHLKDAHTMFSSYFSSFAPSEEIKLEPASDEVLKNDVKIIQYHHEHLAKLAHAFNELREASFDLLDSQTIESTWFSNYLMLGSINDENPSVTRTPLFRPPIANDNSARVSEVKFFYKRIERLIENFKIPEIPTDQDKVDIRLTPSKLGGRLGDQAIPYFYNNLSVREFWNPEKTRKHRAGEIFSYHHHGLEKNNPTPFRDPWKYRADDYDFVRVEGHLGFSPDIVQEKLEELREANGISFEIHRITIENPNGDDDTDSEPKFNQFVKKNPGIDSLSGVPIGGTLLLVVNDGKVVGDLSIPYRIHQHKVPESNTPNIFLSVGLGFCETDNTKYPISFSPPGGEFSNTKGVTIDGKNAFFTPNESEPEDQTVPIEYTKEGQKQSLYVTVHKVPKIGEVPNQLPVNKTTELSAEPKGGVFFTRIKEKTSQEGISVDGEKTTFSPNGLDQGEIVTFIYRVGHCCREAIAETKIVAPVEG